MNNSNQSFNSKCTNNIVEIRANGPAIPLPDWGEGGPVQDPNMPTIPLPDFGEGGPVQNPNMPVIPLPDFGEGGPVQNPNMPVIPLPDFGEGGPVQNPNMPVIPLPDFGEGGPVNPCPNCNGRFSKVRFLNAAENYGSLRIMIGPRLIASNLSYSNMTPYNNVQEGYRIVTITSASSPRTILYQSEIPFNAGEIITLAIIRTLNNIELLRISDAYNLNNPNNRGAIRLANLVFNSPPLDLFLANGRVIFSDVRYREVTLFKQARPKKYNFYLAETPYYVESKYDDIELIEEMPMILQYGNYESVARFSLDVKANTMYTIYILGTWPNPIFIKIVDNR